MAFSLAFPLFILHLAAAASLAAASATASATALSCPNNKVLMPHANYASFVRMFRRFFSIPSHSLASYLAGCCCHSSSWFTFSFLAGPPVLSESIIGTLGRLPCNVTPPIYEDRVALVIWYKVGLKTPIYRWVKPPMRMHFKALPALPYDSLVSLHSFPQLAWPFNLCVKRRVNTPTHTHTGVHK